MPVMLKDDERKLDNSNLIKDFAYPIKRIWLHYRVLK
jgi:hypothetical protein